VGPRASLDGCGKSQPPPGFNLQTIQPITSRYTDSAIAAHTLYYTYSEAFLVVTQGTNCGTSSLLPWVINGRNMEEQLAKLSLWSSRMRPHVQYPCNICLEDSISETPQKCW
jgi:hypothetical protein